MPLPTPSAQYSVADQSQLRAALDIELTRLRFLPTTGTTARSAYIDPTNPTYGVVGDGTTDDTAAFQAALDAGNTQHKVVDARNLIIKVTSALTMAGPGLLTDATYGNNGDGGILVSGTGYTGLTVTAGAYSVTEWQVTMYGTGNTANGIYLNNPQRSKFDWTRVYNLDGFHWKVYDCYDCVWVDVAVELGGNASNYHASINNAISDTSNMSHILRLQVEQSRKQSIYVDDASLCLVIDNIHSERAAADGSYTTWRLNGGSCTWNGGRFHSASGTSLLWLRGAYATFIDYRAESVTNIYLEGTSGTGIVLVCPNFTGITVSEYSGQSGALVIVGGTYGTWSGSTANRFFFGRTTSSWLLPTTQLAAAGGGGTGGGKGTVGDGNSMCLLFIVTDGGEMALVNLNGGNHSTGIALSIAGTWSTTAATANKINVYWDGGSSQYKVENNISSARFYSITRTGFGNT